MNQLLRRLEQVTELARHCWLALSASLPHWPMRERQKEVVHHRLGERRLLLCRDLAMYRKTDRSRLEEDLAARDRPVR